MRFTSVLIIFYCTVAVAGSQDLANRVIASAGSFSNSTSFKLSCTIGEMVVEKLETENIVFTTGFQQYWDLPVGIEDLPESIRISAWPNPASEKIYLRFDNSGGEKTSLKLISMTGVVLMSRELGQYAGGKVEELDLGLLSPGIYFLKVITGGKYAGIIKVVKE